MKTVNELSKRMKMLRIDRGENLEDMAARLGITSAYLSNMETKGIIPAQLAKKIIGMYNIEGEEKTGLVNTISDGVLKRFWGKK
jgi:transcriptional regulator with XRE-family HTH domain